MKRTYTCIREIVSKRGTRAPWAEMFNRETDANAWIREHGVDVHSNEALAGRMIHQCRDGSWALILRAGSPMALRHSVTLFRPEVGVG